MLEKRYVPGMGNASAKLMILGEAPGYEETKIGKPFVGPSGKELDRLLKDSGFQHGGLSHECLITTSVKSISISLNIQADNLCNPIP